MLFDQCFSELGRTSAKTIDGLRRQLGHGCDPAFDYEEDARQKREAEKLKERQRLSGAKHTEDLSGSAGASGMDQLRRALRDCSPEGAGAADEARGEDASMAQMSPHQLRKRREATRNTAAFKARTRESLSKLDVANR